MVHFKTCLLLKLCDEDKKHLELAKINKIYAAAAAAATAKNKADFNARAKAGEVINLEESLTVNRALPICAIHGYQCFIMLVCCIIPCCLYL